MKNERDRTPSKTKREKENTRRNDNNDLLDSLSFLPDKGKDEDLTMPSTPVAPPPFAPPPPPPSAGSDCNNVGDDDNDEERQRLLGLDSEEDGEYGEEQREGAGSKTGKKNNKSKDQKKKKKNTTTTTTSTKDQKKRSGFFGRKNSTDSTSSNTKARSAPAPAIEHYGGNDVVVDDDGITNNNNANARSLPLGDALLNPNRGITNSAQGAGTTLPEIVWRMRVINIFVCTMALLLEIPSLLFLRNVFNPSKFILGVYLIFFAGLLCCFELHTPHISQMIEDNFGLLYGPVGRAVFMFIMGTLSLGQCNLIEFVLGAIIMGNAVYTLYVQWRYPEYRKMYDRSNEEQNRMVGMATERVVKQYAWANPDRIVVGSGIGSRLRGVGEESQTLMGK